MHARAWIPRARCWRTGDIVSETVERGHQAGQHAELQPDAGTSRSRGRGRWVTLGVVVVIVTMNRFFWRRMYNAAADRFKIEY